MINFNFLSGILNFFEYILIRFTSIIVLILNGNKFANKEEIYIKLNLLKVCLNKSVKINDTKLKDFQIVRVYWDLTVIYRVRFSNATKIKALDFRLYH